MSQTSIKTLQRLVERSRLLTPDRKEELLKRLSTFSPEQQEKLQKVLDEEGGVLTAFTEQTLVKAVEKGDGSVLKRLDDFLVGAGKKLRKAEEEAEITSEKLDLDTFFDVVT